MKSMGFIKSWSVDKTLSLDTYFKILMSLLDPNTNSIICVSYFSFHESKETMVIIDNEEEANRKKEPSFLFSFLLHLACLMLTTSFSLSTPSPDSLLGFHFLEKNSSLFFL